MKISQNKNQSRMKTLATTSHSLVNARENVVTSSDNN